MPHTGLDPVTFAYLSLSLPSSRGVRSGLFSKPFYKGFQLGFRLELKVNKEKKEKRRKKIPKKKKKEKIYRGRRRRIVSFTKTLEGWFFGWSLNKKRVTRELYVRVTACKGEREKRKKGFRRLHPCCLSFVLSLYKNNNSLKNGVPFRVY